MDQAFADAAADNPGFEGTEVAVGAYTSEGFGAYVRGDNRVDFMEQLGFVNKADIQALAGENFFVPVSDEQLSLLDAPLTVVFPIFVEASEITAHPLWPTLGSVQQGHAVVLDDETAGQRLLQRLGPGDAVRAGEHGPALRRRAVAVGSGADVRKDASHRPASNR